jgi:hypothetical protein
MDNELKDHITEMAEYDDFGNLQDDGTIHTDVNELTILVEQLETGNLELHKPIPPAIVKIALKKALEEALSHNIEEVYFI